MTRLPRIAVLGLLAFASGCSDADDQSQNAAPTQSGDSSDSYPSGSQGTLISPGGNELGTLRASDGPDGLVLQIEARGLQPGMHGLRVHGVGKCQGPNFVSAGPPAAVGNDLPDVTIESDGLWNGRVTVPAARLAELRDSDGSSLVLLMNPDNPPSDQSGNAGDRIACAVI